MGLVSYTPPPLPLGPMTVDASMGILDAELELFECFAMGTYKEDVVLKMTCSGCVRPENPCIIDIDVHIEGDGIYEIVPDYTLFSLDTTNGIDGTWHVLRPLTTDPQHVGQFFEVHGKGGFRYVADMCDHISSWFSEPRMCFRITIKIKTDTDSTFGGFDDSGNKDDVASLDPTVSPTGGCRQSFYGPRLPLQ